MAYAPAAEATALTAALGPTNTGKTHRAVERMLDHDTGMLGLPLRLLAREVYDRLTVRLGEGQVALVTGEERRVPAKPAYWVCTVEAMPPELEVDFVAVDEIQLAADRDRGHVFTDRLLYRRGRRETWFLGSDTMRPMVERLLPVSSLRPAQRLSQLRYAGVRSLRSLPPRSAVVGFSTDQVYELAERLRRLRGGVAVVLGALSPRTRNAQVAMYQAGEVQYVVATDAIGMGLNLDIDHVAFAGIRKFDGREHRPLTAAELGQIAGRAGRHLNDGTFGTLTHGEALRPRVVQAIEAHQFIPVRRLIWRNPDLCFESVDALLESLSVAPPRNELRRVDRAEDFRSLQEVSARADVRELAEGEARVRLLWEVCQIPDFRKLLLHRHVGLLREIFLQLCVGDGVLRDEWLVGQLGRLRDTTGGIDTLTARLAAVRTWTYVSQRAAWLADPGRWRKETRAIEDALGDALHQRLVERFVERGRSVAPRRRRRRATEPKPSPPPADSPFAELHALAASLPSANPDETEEAFVERVVAAPYEELTIDRRGRVSFEAEPIGRVVRGKAPTQPEAVIEGVIEGAGSRRRLERRLQAAVRDLVVEASGGFVPRPVEHPEARALGYLLAQGFGVALAKAAESRLAALDEAELRRSGLDGLVRGARHVYVAGALQPTALERRALLVALHRKVGIPDGVPATEVVSLSRLGRAPDARAYGYVPLGREALRVDVFERVAVALRGRSSAPPILVELRLSGEAERVLLSRLGIRRDGRRLRPRSPHGQGRTDTEGKAS
ncbi:MAG: helicase-related protein [Myxococcota bacterium]